MADLDFAAPVLTRMRWRLSYADCDPAGIIYFATYVPWVERATTEFFVEVGLPQNRLLEEVGVFIPARRCEVDFLAPARLLDQILVTMRCGRLGETSLSNLFEYERESDGRLMARIVSTHVCVDADFRVTPVPDRLRALLRPDLHPA